MTKKVPVNETLKCVYTWTEVQKKKGVFKKMSELSYEKLKKKLEK